jgi:hypothetical protein
MATFDPSRLSSVRLSSLDSLGYRNQASGFDVRSGEGARRFGGRFNPPRSFPVIYLCTSRPCVVAELATQAARQSVQVSDLLPRELWTVAVHLDPVARCRRRTAPGECPGSNEARVWLHIWLHLGAGLDATEDGTDRDLPFLQCAAGVSNPAPED